MFFKSGRPMSLIYDKLQTEDQESLISNPENSSIERPTHYPSPRAYWSVVIRALTPIITLLAGLWLGYQYHVHAPSSKNLILAVSQNSPMLQDIDVEFNVVRFNGTFLHENVFRQDAGPEVDAAWESLGADYRSIAVPASLAPSVGLAADQVKISAKYGGGYPANVEGLHHLHCLNLLRKSLYYNYEHYHALGHGAFKNSDAVIRKHTSHCLDILRQQLMCSVDIGVLGQVWWDTNADEPGLPPSPAPFTDFNTLHKCRNFEAVRQWAEERQLPEDVPEDFLEPPKPGDRVYNEIP